MIRMRRLFLHDMGRKLLALALAVTTWWFVNDQITVTRTESFGLAVTDTPSPASGRSLTVLLPDGWVLTEPALGSDIEIAFEGERGRLDSILASGLGAFYDPEDDLLRLVAPSPETTNHTVHVALEDLKWNVPDAAAAVFEDRTDKIDLTFELEDSLVVDLDPAMLHLKGEVNPNFELRASQVSLKPSQATFTGSFSRVQMLERRLEEWQALEVKEPLLFFLESVDVEGETSSVTASVSLSSSWASHIHMDPPSVLATLPVLQKLPDPVEFDMGEPVLTRRVAGTEDWEWSGDPLGLWRLSFDPLPDFRPPDDVDEVWIRENLMFFVDLEPLAGIDDLTEQDLPLRWAYIGEDRPDQMNDALRLEPVGSANATVKMKRIQEE